MKKNTTRALTLLLALALCLGLLPTAALADIAVSGTVPGPASIHPGSSGGWAVAMGDGTVATGQDGEDSDPAKGPFSITFDANGGVFRDGAGRKSLTTTDGPDGGVKHKVQFPEEPTREGYFFTGWYLDGAFTQPVPEYMTAGATVVARWDPSPNTPKLFLDPNGGSCAVEYVELSVDGHTAPTLEEELPIPTRDGYTFGGWYVGGKEVTAGGAFSGGETAVAKWTKSGAQDPVRVDFLPNGGSITSIRGIPAGDILAGSALAAEHNIFVDRNSGIGMMMTGNDGRLDEFPVIEREGYTLDGWYTVSSGVLTNAYAGKEVDIPTGAKKADLSTVFRADALLAAKWTTANPNGPFTVKFDLNYKNPKESEIPEDQKLSRGQTVDLPDGKKLTSPYTSHEFYAWCLLGQDGKLYPWKETNPVTADMTLYAGWVRKGTVIKDGEAVPDASGQPAGSTKPAEPTKPAGTAFTDVAATSPFAPAISWAVEKGITNGKTATTFGPGDPCTRAQIVTFLWRAAGSPEPKTLEGEYADVTNKDAYFYKAIQWAAEMGMEESGTFNPGDPCTRGQAMYFIWKARAGASSAGSAPHFTDLSRDSLYYDAVLWAVGQGVTNGTGDGTTFSPDNPCTRGQIVTFLYRAYEQ